MRIKLLLSGKTTDPWVRDGIAEYARRLQHYASFSITELPGEITLKALRPTDHLILLDEHGDTYSSVGWARNLERTISHLQKDLVFAVGGPYGFSDDVRNRADGSLSLSPMTFSHQLVRLVFLEQLYRAFTIMKGEPYHHE